MRGLELDLLVLNEDFEREKVPAALGALRLGLEVRPSAVASECSTDQPGRGSRNKKMVTLMRSC
jgi:hypothetical protein